MSILRLTRYSVLIFFIDIIPIYLAVPAVTVTSPSVTVTTGPQPNFLRQNFRSIRTKGVNLIFGSPTTNCNRAYNTISNDNHDNSISYGNLNTNDRESDHGPGRPVSRRKRI